MRQGVITGWTGHWGEIVADDGETLWVGCRCIADPPNERGYHNFYGGERVMFKRKRDRYRNPYDREKSRYRHKAINVKRI